MDARKREPVQSRRVLALFVATTLLPSLGLAWLGWRMAEQDRALERQRRQEIREHAADLASAALQRLLARAEQFISNSPPPAPDFPVLVFRPGGLAGRSGPPLPYYPGIPPAAEPLGATFAAADALEFRENRFPAALGLLRRLAGSGDRAVRAGALVRIARIWRKAGEGERALRAFRELAALGEAPVGGLPASLVAGQGAALLFEESGRTEDLRREAEVLADELDRGRWPLTRAQYDFQVEQLHRWSRAPEARQQPGPRAAAEAADMVWTRWRQAPDSLPARLPIAACGQSVLALIRSSPDRLAVGLIDSKHLEARWLAELKLSDPTREIAFALSDAEGRPVLGKPGAPPARQSVRTAAATGLPWTVHAIDDGTAPSALSGRSRLLLAGVLCMTVLVLGAGYFAWRAVSRELSVARLQSDFVASVSHEFRTPLTTIRQFSEMLVQGRVSSEERRRQFYAVLLRESDRLHRLVEGLLQFGRMDSGQMPMQFESVDPVLLVREVAGEFDGLAARSGHRVELAVDASLPPVRADRASLGRVLWNLLDNAVKYSPGAAAVRVEASAEAGRVAIRVRDSGIGIPPEEHEQIFRKFVRGTGSKQAAIPGTGVGLAMAKRIVEAHGGRITVESQVGQGSTFLVLLPSGEMNR